MCLSGVDELKLINDCTFFFVVIINHPPVAVHNKYIYYSHILLEIQTFLGGVFLMLFSMLSVF